MTEQQTLQITPEQSRMLEDAANTLATAKREMALIFSAIAAGHGVTAGSMVSLDPATGALVVERAAAPPTTTD